MTWQHGCMLFLPGISVYLIQNVWREAHRFKSLQWIRRLAPLDTKIMLPPIILHRHEACSALCTNFCYWTQGIPSCGMISMRSTSTGVLLVTITIGRIRVVPLERERVIEWRREEVVVRSSHPSSKATSTVDSMARGRCRRALQKGVFEWLRSNFQNLHFHLFLPHRLSHSSLDSSST
jgi:hypothetical protein